jgi:MoaA/NifB/PqqE/SkfB family radical SAM enzyme
MSQTEDGIDLQMSLAEMLDLPRELTAEAQAILQQLLHSRLRKIAGLDDDPRATILNAHNPPAEAPHKPDATRLAKLYLEPTNQCNLQCRTCIRNVWQEPTGMMSDTVFDRVIDGLRDFSPTPTVFFGGFGEPLFHPRIIDMVSQAKGIGARVEMITNGTLLTPDVSPHLLDAGIDVLWVSLDGTTPESYSDIRLGAELPQVIENIAQFSEIRNDGQRHKSNSVPKYNAQLGIEFVAMKRNINDLPSTLVLAHQLGAQQFIMTHLLPYTENMIDQVLYSRGLRENGYPQPMLPPFDEGDPAGEALAAALRNMNVTISGNNRQTAVDHCPFIEGESGAIRWDGGLSPCPPLLHSHVSYPVGRERFSRSWTIGNVAEHDLGNLWNTAEHIAFRKRVLAFSFPHCTKCGGCEMSDRNEEDCLLNTFPTCGGCWWAEGAIRCP